MKVILKWFLLTTLGLFAVALFAQEQLDITQGGYYTAYPIYADRFCGRVYLSVSDYDGVNAVVRATTTCPGSGRGSKPRTWLYCTAITTDGYTITVGDRVLVTSWLQGAASYSCPTL